MTRTLPLLALLALAGCSAALPVGLTLGGLVGLGTAGINLTAKAADIIACRNGDEAGCQKPLPPLAVCQADLSNAPCLLVKWPL